MYVYYFVYLQLQGNLENEIEVLEDLLSMCNDLMDNLGDADIDDR